MLTDVKFRPFVIHLVFLKKKCNVLIKRAKIMYEQSKVRISQLLSAVVCLVIIAVEVA